MCKYDASSNSLETEIPVDFLLELIDHTDHFVASMWAPDLASRRAVMARLVVLAHKSAAPPHPVVFWPEPAYPGGPRYLHLLSLPLDVVWLRRTAVLPDAVRVVTDAVGRTHLTGADLVIASTYADRDEPFRSAGWRVGEDYDGPLGEPGPIRGDGSDATLPSGEQPLADSGRRRDRARYRGAPVEVEAADAQWAWVRADAPLVGDPAGWDGSPAEGGYRARVPRAGLSNVERHGVEP